MAKCPWCAVEKVRKWDDARDDYVLFEASGEIHLCNQAVCKWCGEADLSWRAPDNGGWYLVKHISGVGDFRHRCPRR